jgi:sugar phosphate isomerase/epimerase
MNRRDFVKLSSGLAVTTAIMPSSISDLFGDKKTPLGLQLWSVRDAMKTDAMGTLKSLSKFGYSYVEGFGYNDGKWFGMAPLEMKKALADLGMTQKSGHQAVTTAEYDTSKKDITDSLKKAIDAAVVVGQKYIICPYMQDGDRNKEKVAVLCEAFNKAGEYANKAGLRFGYHNHDFEFTTRIDDMPMYQYLLNNTDPKLVCFEMDMCWVVRGKYNPIDWFKMYPGRFELAHMKDLASQDKSESCIIGTGIVDFKQIIANAKVAGLKNFIVELEHYKAGSVEEVGVCYKNLRKMIA